MKIRGVFFRSVCVYLKCGCGPYPLAWRPSDLLGLLHMHTYSHISNHN